MAANSLNTIIGQSTVKFNDSIIAHTKNVNFNVTKYGYKVFNASTGSEVPSGQFDMGHSVVVEIELEEYGNEDVFELLFGTKTNNRYIIGGGIGTRSTEHKLQIHPIALTTDQKDIVITKAVVASGVELPLESGDSQLIYTITFEGLYDPTIQGVGYIGSPS